MILPATDTDRFMLKPEVIRVTGLSNTTLWREIQAERFPAGVQLSPNRVGWLESAVRGWIQQRMQSPYTVRTRPRRRGVAA